MGQFNEAESKQIATFARYANCGKKPLNKTCKECMKPIEGFKMFFFYQFSRMKKYHYKLFIHYNDKSKQVVVSFGAPSVDNYKYVKRIYSRGWSLIKIYKIRVEREFHVIYYKNIKKTLVEKLNKIKKSGRSKYRFIFTGYSLGGSVATLAAFDMAKSKVLTNGASNLNVYTYGALRIGDAKFVTLINTSLTIWRIVKKNDYIVRIPNCYYSPLARVWRCFTAPVIRKYIISKRFPLNVYIRRYITSVSRGPLGKLLILRKQTPNTNNQQVKNNNFPHKIMTRHAHPSIQYQSTINQAHQAQLAQLAHLTKHVNQNSNIKKPHSFMETKSKHKNIHLNFGPRRWVKPHMVPRGTLRANLVKTYYQYIYYTQPVGVQIFYNTSMTNYQRCNYIAGISSCEKVVNLPTSFTASAHKNYYGINFDKCK
jgi:hypothetical protein